MKTLKVGLISSSLVLFLVMICNYWVVSSGEPFSYTTLENIEARDVGLVLGTGRSVNGRHENPFFTYRMEAAAALYHAGKIKHILVSGDNSSVNYNEPRDMRKKLMALGVPATAITMDFAGLRTLDSIVRAKKIFQQKKIIVISQAFHNYRALFIARYHGIDAVESRYPSIESCLFLFKTT